MSALSAILSPTIDLLRYLETSIDCEWISAEFDVHDERAKKDDDPANAAKSDANKENKPVTSAAGERAKGRKGKKGKRSKKARRTRRTEPSLRISLLKRLLQKRIDEMFGRGDPIEALRVVAEQEQQQTTQRSRSLLSFDFFNRSFQ